MFPLTSTGVEGAELAALHLGRAGSARSVPAGGDAGRPLELELRLPPLHPKLGARLALLAAGGGALFAGEAMPRAKHPHFNLAALAISLGVNTRTPAKHTSQACHS